MRYRFDAKTSLAQFRYLINFIFIFSNPGSCSVCTSSQLSAGYFFCLITCVSEVYALTKDKE